MIRRLLGPACLIALAISPTGTAQEPTNAAPGTSRIAALTPGKVNAGKSTPVLIRLSASNGKPVTPDDLEMAHNEKIHLLVIDQSLTDYHHEHPVPSEKPGEYRFEFTPAAGGFYHMWADVVPTTTHQEEYMKTLLEVVGPPAAKQTEVNRTAEVDGYRFEFSTENNKSLQAGKAALVKINVTDPDGQPVRELEPVMGAFAHMVAFPENLESVTPVHAAGKQPQNAEDRGGPELQFNVLPDQAGYHKFFLQTRIAAKDRFVSFGLNVESVATSPAPISAVYTCPMHPNVKQTAPGKCPECGMTLVARE